MGGPSKEREVSLRTGKGVAAALESRGFAVQTFDVAPGKKFRDLDWTHPPDIVFIALHGAFGEDGTIQGFLQSVQIPFVGSDVQSSALAMHKTNSKLVFAHHGLPSPSGFDFVGTVGMDAFIQRQAPSFFEKKWFIKPAREGSTIGIERFDPAHAPDGPRLFRELCLKALEFDQIIVVEEWIEGPELTVPILEGRALPVVEIRPHSHYYDYESKYTKGKTDYLCPAPLDAALTKEVQRLAEKCFEVMECADYARVDIMMAKDGPKILEINTLPGMTETSLVPKSALAAGMDFGAFLEKLVTISYTRQRAKSEGRT